VLHEEQFFELADDLPVKVEFLLGSAQADTLVQMVSDADVDLVYARPSQFRRARESLTCAISDTGFILACFIKSGLS
jgi:hypothetical protein